MEDVRSRKYSQRELVSLLWDEWVHQMTSTPPIALLYIAASAATDWAAMSASHSQNVPAIVAVSALAWAAISSLPAINKIWHERRLELLEYKEQLNDIRNSFSINIAGAFLYTSPNNNPRVFLLLRLVNGPTQRAIANWEVFVITNGEEVRCKNLRIIGNTSIGDNITWHQEDDIQSKTLAPFSGIIDGFISLEIPGLHWDSGPLHVRILTSDSLGNHHETQNDQVRIMEPDDVQSLAGMRPFQNEE